MKKNYIVNIGSGFYQISIIKIAKKLGYKVISCDINPKAAALKYADKKVIVDCHNPKKVYEKLKKYKILLSGVVTGSARKSILTCSYLAKKFNLTYLNLNVAKDTINKVFLSKKFNNDNFLSHKILKNLNSKKNLKKIVIKSNTISGQGGIGVFKLNTKNQKLKEFYNKFNSKEVTIEKFFPGHHLIVTGISLKKNYLIYSCMEKKVDKNLKTISISTKSFFVKKYQKEIERYAKHILTKLKFDNAPFQVEFVMNKRKKFHLGEIEASITGSFVSDIIIPLSTGENFIADCIDVFVEKKNLKESINKYQDIKVVFQTKKNKIYNKKNKEKILKVINLKNKIRTLRSAIIIKN